MKLYLIRHGQSEANLNGYYAGQTQVMLTERGREEAVSARKYLSTVNFDKVYTSDLLRAIDTQKLALPNVDSEQTSLLREIHVGKLAKRTREECKKLFGDSLTENSLNYNFAPYGGENIEMLRDRVKCFIKIVEKSNYENIAAFCHGGFIKTFLETINGPGLDKNIFNCNNCSVSVFEYKNGKWNIDVWNYTEKI